MKKGKKQLKAFSFLESILSVAILSIGIIVVIPLISGSTAHSIDARYHILASFLAQEGIEVITNLRDRNWAEGLDAFDSSRFPTYYVGSNLEVKSKCSVSYLREYIDKDNDCIPSSDPNIIIKGKENIQRMVFFDLHGTGSDKILDVVVMVIWRINNFPVAGNFPTASELDDCTAKNKCTYVKVTLTEWK